MIANRFDSARRGRQAWSNAPGARRSRPTLGVEQKIATRIRQRPRRVSQLRAIAVLGHCSACYRRHVVTDWVKRRIDDDDLSGTAFLNRHW